MFLSRTEREMLKRIEHTLAMLRYNEADPLYVRRDRLREKRAARPVQSAGPADSSGKEPS